MEYTAVNLIFFGFILLSKLSKVYFHLTISFTTPGTYTISCTPPYYTNQRNIIHVFWEVTHLASYLFQPPHISTVVQCSLQRIFNFIMRFLFRLWMKAYTYTLIQRNMDKSSQCRMLRYHKRNNMQIKVFWTATLHFSMKYVWCCSAG